MPVDVERERAEKAKAVVGALQDGRLPTTAQAVQGITEIQADGSLHDAARDMTPAGKKIVADAERILDSTRKVVTQAAPNNELQNAIYYGNQAASRSASRADGLSADEASSAADALVQAGAKSAQLAKMIVTSGEFRTLLTDISSIVQELVQSNVVDATDDLANDPNAPDAVRQYAAKTRDTVANNDLQDAGQQGLENAQDAYEQTKEQAKEQANLRTEEARQRANEAGQEAQDAANNTRNTAGDSLAGGASLRQTAKNVIDTVADEAERRLPEDQVNQASAAIREHGAKMHTGEESTQGLTSQAKQQGQAYLDQGRNLANQAASQLRDPNSQIRQTGDRVARKLANLPEEKKREIIGRIKNVTRVIQSKPEFQNGIDDIIALLAPLATAAKDATSTVVDKAANAPTDPNELQASKDSRLAMSNAKQLIENFANGHSLDPLIKELRGFAADTKDDDELRAFYKDLSAYVNRLIREPGFADDQSFERDAEGLVERGRQQMENYSRQTSNISYEAKSFAQSLAANKTTQRLQKDMSVLISDLFLDERGNPTFKPDLVRDLAKLVPHIASKLAYLPLPRIEVDDGQYHMIFDNIVLHSTILPKYVRIQTDTTVDATQKNPDDQINSHVILEFSNVEASGRDIAWLFNKHKGFWKAGDVGLADLDMAGKGLSVRVKLQPGSEAGRASGDNADTPGRFLNVMDVNTTVHNLDLRLHDSHHDILYKLLKPAINKTAKKQLESAVDGAIRDIVQQLDAKLMQGANAIGAVGGPEPKAGIPEWGSKAYNPTIST
ncbi:hypothetical protein BDZ88DRAFT_403436 [Geranomyces variabilis]|nr:hypothetical protein BDZ88DRAFT_403436 [Geranomyces variabilis]KAJ3141652.1 hypothetical protein HDU90_005995 [Geranomyces variabilis]